MAVNNPDEKFYIIGPR